MSNIEVLVDIGEYYAWFHFIGLVGDGKECKASKQHISSEIQTHCFASHTDALDDSVTRIH